MSLPTTTSPTSQATDHPGGGAGPSRDLVTPQCWSALAHLASAPRGSLWVLSGLAGEAGLLVATDLGALVVGDPSSTDLVVTRPSSDRWTIAELDTEIIARASVLPEGPRRVVVVGYGETLTKAAADHLLKTFEEPAPTTLFILATSDASTLPATIRSRASRLETLTPLPAAPTDAGTGVEPALRAEVAALCGPLVTLAGRVLTDMETTPTDGTESTTALAAARLVFGGGGDPTQPLATARAVADAVTLLSKLPPAPSERPGTDAAATSTKSLSRDIVRRLVEGATARSLARARTASTAASYGTQRKILTALARARAQTDVYVPTAEVLATLFAALALASAPTPPRVGFAPRATG